MLLVRRSRVTVVPAISLGLGLLLATIFVQQVVVAGEPLGSWLPGFGVPAVVFLGYAVLSVCRLERRDDQLRWGRLLLGQGHPAARCGLQGTAYANANGGFLAIDVLAQGQPVLQVMVFREGDKATAKAQRMAEALGLPYTRVSRDEPR
jgi:hypothetical protein